MHQAIWRTSLIGFTEFPEFRNWIVHQTICIPTHLSSVHLTHFYWCATSFIVQIRNKSTCQPHSNPKHYYMTSSHGRPRVLHWPMTRAHFFFSLQKNTVNNCRVRSAGLRYYYQDTLCPSRNRKRITTSP